MEEGGGESRGEVERRLESWAVDEAMVVDIVEFGRRAELESREIYRDELLEYRIERLRQLIDERQPAAVVFYSLSYLEYWRQIAGGLRQRELGDGSGDSVWFCEWGGTAVIVCQHPAAFGATNAYFATVSGLL